MLHRAFRPSVSTSVLTHALLPGLAIGFAFFVTPPTDAQPLQNGIEQATTVTTRLVDGPTTQEVAYIDTAKDSLSRATASVQQLAKLIEVLKQSVDNRAVTIISDLAKSSPEYREKLQRVAELKKEMDATNRDAALTEQWIEADNATRKVEHESLGADSECSRLSRQLKDAMTAKAAASADAIRAASRLKDAEDTVSDAVGEREALRQKEKTVYKGMTRSDVEDLWGQPASSETNSSGEIICTYREYAMKDAPPPEISDYHVASTDRPDAMAFVNDSPTQVKTEVRELRATYVQGVLVDFDIVKMGE